MARVGRFRLAAAAVLEPVGWTKVIDLAGRTIREGYFWVLKNTLNRVTVRLAATRFGPFSLVRHVGRKSGKSYETPLILAAVPEGFVAELTYGEKVDWYRNVAAAGGCVVVHRGKSYRVSAIERCTAERGLTAFPPPFRQILRAAGRRDFRLLRTDDGANQQTGAHGCHA